MRNKTVWSDSPPAGKCALAKPARERALANQTDACAGRWEPVEGINERAGQTGWMLTCKGHPCPQLDAEAA